MYVYCIHYMVTTMPAKYNRTTTIQHRRRSVYVWHIPFSVKEGGACSNAFGVWVGISMLFSPLCRCVSMAFVRWSKLRKYAINEWNKHSEIARAKLPMNILYIFATYSVHAVWIVANQKQNKRVRVLSLAKKRENTVICTTLIPRYNVCALDSKGAKGITW